MDRFAHGEIEALRLFTEKLCLVVCSLPLLEILEPQMQVKIHSPLCCAQNFPLRLVEFLELLQFSFWKVLCESNLLAQSVNRYLFAAERGAVHVTGDAVPGRSIGRAPALAPVPPPERVALNLQTDREQPPRTSNQTKTRQNRKLSFNRECRVFDYCSVLYCVTPAISYIVIRVRIVLISNSPAVTRL